MTAQGRLISNRLDQDTGKFVAVLKVDSSIDAPTEIYAKVSGKGIQWYPKGYDLMFLSNGKKIEDLDSKIKILDSGHMNKLAFKVID